MSRKQNFEHILEESLQSLRRGETPEAIAARYPEDEDRLLPLLKTADWVSHMPAPVPSERAKMDSKARLMQTLSQQKQTHQIEKKNVLADLGNLLLRQRAKGLILAGLSLVLLFIFVSSIGVASAQAVPGSWLYPVKLTIQEIHILLTFDTQSREQLMETYQAQRQMDIETAIENELLPQDEASATLAAMPNAPITPTPLYIPTETQPSIALPEMDTLLGSPIVMAQDPDGGVVFHLLDPDTTESLFAFQMPEELDPTAIYPVAEDGRLAYFVVQTARALYRLSVDGQALLIFYVPDVPTGPLLLSLDGRWLFWGASDENSRYIKVVSLEDMQVQVLVEERFEGDDDVVLVPLAVTWDSEYLFYAHQRGSANASEVILHDLNRLDMSEGIVAPMVYARDYQMITFSPNGYEVFLLYREDAHLQFRRVNLRSGVVDKLTFPGGMNFFEDVDWSPDSNSLILRLSTTRDPETMVVFNLLVDNMSTDLDYEVLFENYTASYQVVAWPGGRHLWLQDSDGAYWVYDLQDRFMNLLESSYESVFGLLGREVLFDSLDSLDWRMDPTLHP